MILPKGYICEEISNKIICNRFIPDSIFYLSVGCTIITIIVLIYIGAKILE